MPRKPSPKDFKEMIGALTRGLSEDPEEVFSLTEQEVDRILSDEGINPERTITKVHEIVRSFRQISRIPESRSPVSKSDLRLSNCFWTNPSVLKLKVNDPISYITRKASELILKAIGTHGFQAPFDPVKLAHFCGIKTSAKADVPDARIVPAPGGEYQIEFNPTKPKPRVRFSIAHELAHTLFEDCHEAVRYRLSKSERRKDDWQLEMLCNLAAAEFLMPVGHFPLLRNTELSIRRMLEIRDEYEVSTEAVLLRFVRLTDLPCAVFGAAERRPSRYVLEYSVQSRSWPVSIPSGTLLPKTTCLRQCSAVGYTAVGDENWLRQTGTTEVQCVRISPFPDESVPRMVGFIRPSSFEARKSARINYVIGDATEPRGGGHRIIAQVVSDKSPIWGRGFGWAVRNRWPEVEDAFRKWATPPRGLALGSTFHSQVLHDDITVFQMVCQHGYSAPQKIALRYSELRSCLEDLALFAIERQGSVHMPKIGTGEAGGSWKLIEQLIDEVVCARGLDVTLYELPSGKPPKTSQPGFFD